MTSSDSDTSSSSSGTPTEDLGQSIIPMAIPISANPRAQDIPTPLVYPDHPCRFKEHLAVATAREFGLMPSCDIRSPGNEDRVAIAREGEFVIFKDSLKGGFRWPLHPFFLALLTEHNMSLGQLVPNGWRMLTYFLLLVDTSGLSCMSTYVGWSST